MDYPESDFIIRAAYDLLAMKPAKFAAVSSFFYYHPFSCYPAGLLYGLQFQGLVIGHFP
jgi:hypothetical protein